MGRKTSNTQQSFDQHAASYDAWFDTSPGSLQYQGEIAALKLLTARLPRPWMEIGVGTGRFTQDLSAEFGLDPSRKMLRMAENRGVLAVQGVGESLPFKDGIFGSAIIMTTLCFVRDPKAVVMEARRVLQPNAALVLGIILRDSAWGRHYQELGKKRHPLYRHARFFTAREAEDMLRECGFRITGRACSVIQPPGRVVVAERGWWGYSQSASFAALQARKLHNSNSG